MQTHKLQPRIGIASLKVFGMVFLFFSLLKFIAGIEHAEITMGYILLFLKARFIEATVASVVFWIVFYLISRRCDMTAQLNDRELIAPVKTGMKIVSKKIPLTDIKPNNRFPFSFNDAAFSTLEDEKIMINHICYPSKARREFKAILQQRISEERSRW